MDSFKSCQEKKEVSSSKKTNLQNEFRQTFPKFDDLNSQNLYSPFIFGQSKAISDLAPEIIFCIFNIYSNDQRWLLNLRKGK